MALGTDNCYPLVPGGMFSGASPGGDWPLVLDFENGSYTSASETYALEDVWVPDTDWGNGGDLANVQNGVGLVNDSAEGSSQDFHFADMFAELVTAGPIVVLDFTSDGNPASGIYGVLYELDNFTDNDFQVTTNPGLNRMRDGASGEVALPDISNGDHKVAIRFNADQFAISIDGAANVLFPTPAPGDFPFTRFMLSLLNNGGTSVLRSATFRDPAEGEAALPALSA